MPIKPVLMSDLRKIANSPSASHRSLTGTGSYNRFEPLLNRPRLFSNGKRQLSPGNQVAQASFKFPRLDANKIFDKLQGQDTFLETARKELETASNAILASCKPDDGGMGTALTKIASALTNIISGNEALKSSIINIFKASENAAKEAPPPTPTTPLATGLSVQVPKNFNFNPKPARSQPPPEETLAIKVKKALREAERRTIIYDLDLGPSPTLNKETISRKVTVALHDKGKEGNHNWALQDAAEMIDDALSCSQLEFLGSGTRKFYNRRDATDKRNGKWCTVPVRMDFKNKETRTQAENTLRSICKVNCSTPYPRALRTMIHDTVKKGKQLHEDCFIKVKVDIDNMVLSASAKTPTGWTNLPLDQAIPLDILDKSVPPTLSSNNTGNSNPMEVADTQTVDPPLSYSGSQQGGGRGGRLPGLCTC